MFLMVVAIRLGQRMTKRILYLFTDKANGWASAQSGNTAAGI
jgi:hypothetical protein